ncbi:hypothetical protein PoB_005606200 [Plakobranchus ocellatus]|uniref:Integrase zinc-binding domain-containing protein n=1 Tax=Plakobranchus ocellatus TaxID=259542 RepID=A0AAV4CE00_9GAST|nr:hypothetical protein PoB_005606200 [Plakobranchus ocellatus]
METTQISSHQQKVAEDYIQQISLDSVPKSLTLSDIKTETMKDPTFQFAISCMQQDKWNNQLVIPKSLQDKCIDLTHEGYLGIVKTKQLLREKIWFPGIDAKVEAKTDRIKTTFLHFHPLHPFKRLYNKTKLTDYAKKQKLKENADKRNSQPSTINIGDTVLVKQVTTNEQTPPFDPQPLIVTNKKESMVTASRGSMDKTRNSSFFKKVSPQIPLAPDPTEEDDIELQPFDIGTPDDRSTESNSSGPSTELQVELPCSPSIQAERPAPPVEPHRRTSVPHTHAPYTTKSGPSNILNRSLILFG